MQWVQPVSLFSYAVARHLELKECSGEKTIALLREEIVKLRESHAGEIRSLEEKVKNAEDKYLAGQKE